MISNRLAFHHFGLAVTDDVAALAFLTQTGYACGEKIFDPEQNVFLRICTSEKSPTVEIVMPGEGVNPLTAVLKKQRSMIYHLCYEVPDCGNVIAEFEDADIRCFCVSPPKPAVLFGGRRVAFYQVPGFGLIELLEAGMPEKSTEQG